ncbi:MAG: saccharopine dehydrogenase family protein [Myxococcota bacterium]
MTGDLLVVGGYGVVGRRVVARLAPLLPGQLIVGGRDESKAAILSHDVGNGTRGRKIDVNVRSSVDAALEGVGTVLSCVAQSEPHLLRAAVARGLAYTDTSPRLAFWRATDELVDQAQHTGARIVLGAGLSPGVSNMMAARMAAMLGGVDMIETAIALSLGDEYGPDSMVHVLESLKQPFEILREGHSHSALPFTESRTVEFPPPIGPQRAYVFPWSDVVNYPSTLGAQTSVGRFALLPAWLGRAASGLMKLGVSGLLHGSSAASRRRKAIDGLKRWYTGHDEFGLVVRAERAGRVLTMSLGGRQQAEITAYAAADFARQLAQGAVQRPGLWFPEQVFDPERFLSSLAEAGWSTATGTSS